MNGDLMITGRDDNAALLADARRTRNNYISTSVQSQGESAGQSGVSLLVKPPTKKQGMDSESASAAKPEAGGQFL